jgi:hypothetical protein
MSRSDQVSALFIINRIIMLLAGEKKQRVIKWLDPMSDERKCRERGDSAFDKEGSSGI